MWYWLSFKSTSRDSLHMCIKKRNHSQAHPSTIHIFLKTGLRKVVILGKKHISIHISIFSNYLQENVFYGISSKPTGQTFLRHSRTPKPLYKPIAGIQNKLSAKPCCIQTKMYTLYTKMTINGHFSSHVLSIHFCLETTLLGSMFKPSRIWNCCIINCLIEKFQRICFMLEWNKKLSASCWNEIKSYQLHAEMK